VKKKKILTSIKKI